MNYLPMAFAAGLIATPAVAGMPQSAICTGTNGIVASTGLGAGGFACSEQPLRPQSPGLRAWIITGDDPGPVITVTVDNAPIIGLNPAGGIRRGECVALPAWTMPEYAAGYPIPEWPVVFMDQSAYDVAGRTVTLRLRTMDPMLTLQPNSNYSLNVQCLVRLF